MSSIDAMAHPTAKVTLQASEVFYLPGMGGMRRRDRRFCDALGEAVAGRVEPVEWTRYRWLLQLGNLRDQRLHRASAADLAERLDVATPTTNTRTVLIGHSTGAKIVLDVLATLSAARVTQAWLLAAAVSRRYDLSPALRNTDRLISVHSRRDFWHLWAGTSLLGSADGVWGPAGGWRPFIGKGSNDAKLLQQPYRRHWRSTGYRGGHLGVLRADFAREVIAPMITRGRFDAALL